MPAEPGDSSHLSTKNVHTQCNKVFCQYESLFSRLNQPHVVLMQRYCGFGVCYTTYNKPRQHLQELATELTCCYLIPNFMP